MSNSVCYFIPDTNVFLHYLPFTDINWTKELDVDEAIMVICYTVIKQLGEKELSPDRKIRERAKKAVSRLKKISDENNQIRDDVKLMFITEEPKLDSDVEDDKIIATILCESAYLKPLVLVTSDFGLQMKAKLKGITYYELSKKYFLEPSKTDEEKEYETLKKRLAILESSLPELSIQFLSDEELTKVVHYSLTKPTPLSVEDEHGKLSEMREKLEYVPPPPLPKLAGLDGIYEPPSDNEIKRYKEDVEKYLERLSKFFDDRCHYLDELSRTIKLKFALVNNGNAPAEDIDIFLYFPDGTEINDEDYSPNEPIEPEKPVRPRNRMQLMMDQMRKSFEIPDLSSIVNRSISIRDLNDSSEYPPGPSIEKTNSYKVTYRSSKLKHGFMMELGSLYATFTSWEEAKSFEIGCQIIPDNYPEEIFDKLHVVVKISQ